MNPLAPLTQLANGLPNLLASVSSRLETYFTNQNRFQPQFLFPTLGFLLGCLGLIMGLLTPGAPRAWWDGLNADVKLLFLALLFLLFILVEAISSNLVLLVKRLYSGEWLLWWQRPGRQRFLEERLAREAEQRQLQIAQDALIRAERQIKAMNNVVGDSAEKPARYPVLRVGLPAYQLIGAGDWIWQETPAATGVAANPADIIGRYTLTSLPAGQPIPLDKLNSLPRADYLEPARRQILTLALYAGDDTPALKPGDPFSLGVAPRQGQPTVFADLLLLDRLPDHRWVVSAPAGQADDLTQRLAAAYDVTIRYDIEAAQQRVVALPTAAQALAPGQLIQADDFTWRMCQLIRRDQTWFVAPDIPLERVITQAQELIDMTQGYYFWPETFDVGAPPSNLSPIKCPGDVFTKDEVKCIADRAWLTFTNTQGQTISRRAYWLQGSTVVERLPVVTGDRLVVTSPVAGGPPASLETWAFVYHKPVATGYFLAVKDPITFDAALSGAALVELSPFTEVPVLQVSRQPGDLIDATQVVVAPYRANDASLIGNMCLEVAEVIDHYVRTNGNALAAGKPVPRARLGQTSPVNYVAVDLAPARTPTFPAGVQRGDLVSLVIEHPLGKIPRTAAFISAADFDSVARRFTRLTVALPPDLAAQANALLPSAAVAVEISHTDASVETALSKSENAAATARASALSALNDTLSAGDPDESALVERADALLARVKELTDLNRVLSERPWGVGYTTRGENWYVAARRRQASLTNDLRAVVANWRISVQQILLNRQQGARLTLPDNLAETRPTGLGNILAAAAEYPLTAYGIHTPTILPRLLQALTTDGSADPVVTRLVNAENALNMLLLFSFWAGVWTLLGVILFIAIGVVWWLWPIVLLGGPLAWWLTKEGAEAQAYAYGDALKALFDQRRRVLFQNLNLTLPDTESLTLADERRYWRHLYQLFAYGQVDPDFPAIKLAKEQQDA